MRGPASRCWAARRSLARGSDVRLSDGRRQLVPINWRIAVQLAIVTLLPLTPLALTVFSDAEIASMLLGVLF